MLCPTPASRTGSVRSRHAVPSSTLGSRSSAPYGFCSSLHLGDGSQACWKTAGSCVGGSHGAAGSPSHRRENISALGVGPKGGCQGQHGSPKGISSPCCRHVSAWSRCPGGSARLVPWHGGHSLLCSLPSATMALLAPFPAQIRLATSVLVHKQGQGRFPRAGTHSSSFYFHFWPDVVSSRLSGSRLSWAQPGGWQGPGAPLAPPAGCPVA